MLNPIVNNPFGNGFLQNDKSLPTGLGVNSTQNQINKVGAENTPNVLKDLGVDTTQIEQKVDQDIQNIKTYSQEDFKQRVEEMSKGEGISLSEAYHNGLKYIKSHNGVIDGIDIDKELVQLGETTQTNYYQEKPQEDKGSFVGNLFKGSGDALASGLTSFGEGMNNFVGGAASELSSATGNVLGFTLGNAVDGILNIAGVDHPDISQAISELGEEGKKSIQEFSNVDPEALTTKVGEIGSEIGLMFVPGGQAKLVAKFPKLGKTIGEIGTMFNKLEKTAPKTYKVLSSNLVKKAGIGAGEAAKFDIIDNGDVSPTSVTIGAAANPALSKIGKIFGGFKDSKELLRGITGVQAGQIKKIGIESLEKDAEIGLKSIVKTGLKPKTRGELLEAFNKRQSDIYKKEIQPALKRAGEKGKINIKGLTDDITKDLNLDSAVFKTAHKDLEPFIKDLKKAESKIKTFEDLENLKMETSALARLTGFKDKQLTNFLNTVDKKVQSKYEDLLKVAGENGLKGLKREYAALSNLKAPLYAKVATEMKGEGLGLVGNFGLFTGMQNLAKGDILGAAQTFMNVRLIDKIRDPNTALHKLIKELYGDKTLEKLTKFNKSVGIGSSYIGNTLDSNQ